MSKFTRVETESAVKTMLVAAPLCYRAGLYHASCVDQRQLSMGWHIQSGRLVDLDFADDMSSDSPTFRAAD